VSKLQTYNFLKVIFKFKIQNNLKMSSSCTTENAEKIYELARNRELLQRDMKGALELYEESANENYLKAVLRLLNYYRVEEKCPDKVQSFVCLYKNLCPSGPITAFDKPFRRHREIENDSKNQSSPQEDDDPWSQVLSFTPHPEGDKESNDSSGEEQSLSNDEEEVAREEDSEDYIVSRNFK
jgi:hypothetical protein